MPKAKTCNIVFVLSTTIKVFSPDMQKTGRVEIRKGNEISGMILRSCAIFKRDEWIEVFDFRAPDGTIFVNVPHVSVRFV